MSPNQLTLRALAAVLVPLCALVADVPAQDNELSVIIGRTFISDQRIEGAPSYDPNLRFGKGLTFKAEYARRVLTGGFWSVALEVPFAVDSDEKVHAAQNLVPKQYSSLFVTPAVRFKVFPDQAVSAWISFGGGLAHFCESSTLEFGGANPGKTGTNTGVLQAGFGLDVRIYKQFSLRGEVRDFWSGLPQLNVNTARNRQTNILGGGGIVWRF